MKKEQDNLKIVFLGRFSESDSPSGPEKVAQRIFREHARRYPSVFIQYFFDGRRSGILKKLFGLEKKSLDNSSSLVTAGLFRILPLLFKIKPDAVHIITFERFAAVSLLYRLIGKAKFVYSVHGVIAYENYVLKQLSFSRRIKDKLCEALFLNYSDRIIFYSERSIDIAESYFSIDERKAIILSSGADEVFTLTPRKVGNKGYLNAVLIAEPALHFSSLDLLKKTIPLIKARLRVNLVGSIISGVQSANSLVEVVFTERMSTAELAKFYSDKDVFLSLNSYNTFSISAVEAMSSGLVPVATKETGMSRYIIDGENGYVIDYGDAEKLARILGTLAADEGLTGRLSRNARGVGEILRWNEVYETYRNIYSELAS